MNIDSEIRYLSENIKTPQQFLIWFANWSANGDQLLVFEGEDGEKIFKAYDVTAFLVAEFSTKTGLKAYK